MQSVENQIVSWIEENIVAMADIEIINFKTFLEENFNITRKGE
jgi:hypothetical protein